MHQFLIGLTACALLLPGRSWGQPSAAPADHQRELLAEAEAAERDAVPMRAASLYRSARDAAPTSRLARRASSRIAWLEARSDGDYGPLAELMEIQRGEITAARMEAFAARLETFPAGKVRRESRAQVASAWLRQLDQPTKALVAFEAWLAEPDLEIAERNIAVSGAVQARKRLGDAHGGLELLRREGFTAEPEMYHLRAAALGEVARPASWLAIVLALAFGLGAGGWRGLSPAGVRLALSPARVVAAAYAVLPPAVIATAYDFTLYPSAPVLAGVCTVALAFAAFAGAGLRLSGASSRVRLIAAAGTSLGALSAGYLVADRYALVEALFWWRGI